MRHRYSTAVMQPAPRIAAESLLPLPQYQRQRAQLRAQAIAHRSRHRLGLGPAMWLQFEDEVSVRHQIQEVLHAERIVERLAVQHTIEHFAQLLGDARQWRATLFIGLPEAARRERELPQLSEAAHHLYLDCGAGPRVVAEANEDLPDRHRARPSAVHFLRFELPPAMRAALRAGQTALLGCAHPAYAWQRRMPEPLLQSLCDGLQAGAAP